MKRLTKGCFWIGLLSFEFDFIYYIFNQMHNKFSIISLIIFYSLTIILLLEERREKNGGKKIHIQRNDTKGQ